MTEEPRTHRAGRTETADLVDVLQELAERACEPSAVLDVLARRGAALVGDLCVVREAGASHPARVPAAVAHREPAAQGAALFRLERGVLQHLVLRVCDGVEVTFARARERPGWTAAERRLAADLARRVGAVYARSRARGVPVQLERRLAQQAAVAAFGERALESRDPGTLCNLAAAEVARVLDVELAGVFELRAGERELLLAAGTGWRPGAAGRAVVPAEWTASQAGFTLLTGRPVVVLDAEEDGRFRGSDLEHEHDVVSGLSVPVEGRGRPFGVLAAHSRRRGAFDADDARFLQAMANVLADAVDRCRAEDRLRRQALHDPLTGLANRALVLDRLELALARAGREGGHVALLFCDLDRFKAVNDALGHRAGDTLLRQVGPRLRDALRPSDTVGRFGGDEFVVLCDSVAGEEEALRIAARVSEVFDEPFALGREEHVVGVSIGVAVAGPEGDADRLVREADTAMYRAKEHGGGRIELHDPGARSRIGSRLRIERGLRHGLEQGELRLLYQPIVALADGGLVGFEALVRWEHPERGLLAPAEFVPVAEDSGLIVPLGRWVLEEAVAAAAGWAGLEVHVNLAARQLGDAGLADAAAAALGRSGVDPANLVLEITESALIERGRRPLDTLEALRRTGARLALDDFGTGYSSLGHLQRYPIDRLKVDRSFVAGLGGPGREAAIVRAILGLASGLGLTVIAEGVETSRQREALRTMGCLLGQGFLWAPPIGPAEAMALAAGDRRLP